MQCPKCGRGIDGSLFPAGLAFCPYCGQNLLSISKETEGLTFCPYCGRELLDKTSFCHHCGKELKVSKKKLSVQKVSRVFLKRLAQPIGKAVRDTFSSNKKTRKLFQQWSEYAELPPDEVPSMETLRKMPEKMRAKRSPRRYLTVGIVGVMIIALVILSVIQC